VGNVVKLQHYTADMFHMKETIYTDSWLFMFFGCF